MAETYVQTGAERRPKVTVQNRRVLIADDDPALVRGLTLRCKKLGLEVETAENGLQAILKAKRRPPHLLIVDINMPEADGFRVCDWLFDAKLPPANIIALTGRSDTETLDRCESLGAQYVRKNNETWTAIRAIVCELFEIEEEQHSADANSAFRVLRNRVLLVEDDVDFARSLECRLKKCGAEILVARNGVEGFRIADRELPDAIVSDYVMPEGGGHYLLWRLKSNDRTKHIPVLIITGQPLGSGTEFPIERELSGRGGATEFFRKPLDMDSFLQALSQHCSITYSAAPFGQRAAPPRLTG